MSASDPNAALEPLRRQIDAIDQQLVELLNQRARVVVEIGKVKRDGQTPIYAPDREQAVLAKVRQHNKGPLPTTCLEAIWRELMSGSFALERPLRIGYLGPPGSFSHLAARRKFGASVVYHPQDSIRHVFDELARDHIDLGLAPIENSSHGTVMETLDAFLDSGARVCAEVLINVHLNLLANCPLNQITRIYSKAEALSQCRIWLEQHLPNAELMAAPSTSKAVEHAAHEPNVAAVGTELAGELFSVKVLRHGIEDNPNNITRFFVIAHESPHPTGEDKTAIMFTAAHQSGALANVLDVFRDHGLNLTQIDKRPSRRVNWEYFFFVDFDGHVADEPVRKAILEARKYCLQINVLGSFPKAREVL